MFCPKCSQSQASEDMRYCSRCGFPLCGVAELVANDGTLPVKSPNGSDVTRRKLISKGWGAITVINLIVAPFVIVGVQSVEAVLIYLFFFLEFLCSGFGWMIYTRPAREDREFPEQKGVSSRDAHSALPPNRNSSAGLFGHQTNELLIPTSVTEGTTKLLEKR